MVSWHWALYRAFFRVPWRALVPVPPSHAPQLSNLYLQSAGGRVPRGQRAARGLEATDLPSFQRGCVPLPLSCPPPAPPPHLQTPSSSCRAPCTGRAGSGPHRYPRGNPRRSPCCWGCRAPRSTQRTRSPGRPSSLCLRHTGNGAQDPAARETHSGAASWGPALGTPEARPEVASFMSPARLQRPTPRITFLFGHRGGERQQGEEGEEEEASVLHPGGEAGERSCQSSPPSPAPFPTGGRTRAPPAPVPTVQALGRRQRRREDSGAGPSPLAGAHSRRRLPGGGLEPRTQLRPPPRLRPPGRLGPSGRGAEAAAARPPGPRALTRSLPAVLRSLPRRARPAPAAAAPFVSRTGLSRSHGPPPPSPPHRGRTRPAPTPQTRAAPRPRRPRLRSRPARPRRFYPCFPPRVPAPHPARPARPGRAQTTSSAGPPSSEPGVSRPHASVLPLHPRPLPPARAPASRPRLCPLPGAVLFPRWTPASPPGEGRPRGWRLGGSSGPRGCDGSRRSARGPRSGLCAAPSPED